MKGPIYSALFQALNREKVRYLVAGGVAVNLHGVPRFTQDLDLVVDLEAKNLVSFVRVVSRLGYRPRVAADPLELADSKRRREWWIRKNMRVFSFYHPRRPLELVDVFIRIPIPYPRLERDQVRARDGTLTVPLISISHLIRFKTGTNRKQDQSDIDDLRALERIRKGSP